ncbi:MAG: amidohydrolase family protein, partial [Planctomycetes bacterium]|nr:amidohydrolase family protein [Planctomycetota bacterium]
MGLIRIVSADWIFPPGEKPIEQGAVLLHGKEILDIGSREAMQKATQGARENHLANHVLIPGLINGHTHLELASLDRLPITNGFASWIRALLQAKASLSEDEILAGAENALTESMTFGTAFVADVASSALTSLAMIGSDFPGMVFREFLGHDEKGLNDFERSKPLFDEDGMEGVRILPCCHAPFSTSKELFRAIGDWSRSHGCPTMVHLAESPEEMALLQTGESTLASLLIDRGVAPDRIPMPGISPIAYLDRLAFLTEHTVAVHLVQATLEDLETLKERKVKLCLCPSSNRYLFGSLPPVKAMLDLGTGTGLLAIAAARLGVEAITAVDNNPLACRVAEKNIRLNNLNMRI